MSDTERINNSQFLKVVNKFIKKRYSWVKDIKLSERNDPYEYNSLMFVSVYMNPSEFSNAYDVTLKEYVMKWLGNKNVLLNQYSSLCTLVDGPCPEEIKDIENLIDRDMSDIVRRNIIPKEMYEDLLKGRTLSVTSYVMTSST